MILHFDHTYMHLWILILTGMCYMGATINFIQKKK